MADAKQIGHSQACLVLQRAQALYHTADKDHSYLRIEARTHDPAARPASRGPQPWTDYERWVKANTALSALPDIQPILDDLSGLIDALAAASGVCRDCAEHARDSIPPARA